MNWLGTQLDLKTDDGELNETRYGELMNNLNPSSLCEFFREIGLTANETKSLLIKTLYEVETNSGDFGT